jgi:hypothetical protein
VGIGWGITTGVLWSLWMSFRQWDRLPLNLVLAMILFPIGGYFFGKWTWNKSESGFQQANQND